MDKRFPQMFITLPFQLHGCNLVRCGARKPFMPSPLNHISALCEACFAFKRLPQAWQQKILLAKNGLLEATGDR